MTSLSAVNSALASLKTCQTDIGTGMDIVTEVALDLVECEGKWSTLEMCLLRSSRVFLCLVPSVSVFFHSGNADNPNLKRLEEMMLECAKLDREIDCFVEVVDTLTAQVCYILCFWLYSLVIIIVIKLKVARWFKVYPLSQDITMSLQLDYVWLVLLIHWDLETMFLLLFDPSLYLCALRHSLCFTRQGRTQRPWLPWATQWRPNLPGWWRGRLKLTWIDMPKWWLLRTAFRTLCQKVSSLTAWEKKQLSVIKSWHLREERASHWSNVITS